MVTSVRPAAIRKRKLFFSGSANQKIRKFCFFVWLIFVKCFFHSEDAPSASVRTSSPSNSERSWSRSSFTGSNACTNFNNILMRTVLKSYTVFLKLEESFTLCRTVYLKRAVLLIWFVKLLPCRSPFASDVSSRTCRDGKLFRRPRNNKKWYINVIKSRPLL